MEYEILGEYDDEYDIMGDDEYDVGLSFGQLRRALDPRTHVSMARRAGRAVTGRSRSRGRPRRRSRPRPSPRSAAIVRAGVPDNAKTLLLNIDSGAAGVAAGASATFTVQPSNVFRPIRFIVDPVTAPNFTIDTVLVGRKNQFVNGNAAAATVFTANAVGVMIDWDTLQISEQLTVTVTNLTGQASRFMASLVGTALT